MDLKFAIKKLEHIADQECTCTIDQQTGKDYTMCKSCRTGYIINQFIEIAKDELDSIKD